jgi:hypothetical protein
MGKQGDDDMGTFDLDHYLYFNEDHDLPELQMEDWTAVDPMDLVELHQRGLLMMGEVFSHKGWHHMLEHRNQRTTGTMWDGPSGEEMFWRGNEKDNEWG